MKPDAAPPQLTLRSELAELPRAVVWLKDLAAFFHIPPATLNAMDLCLEEALSNIIRHGYLALADRTIVVRYQGDGNGELVLVVEDGAPAFDPLAAELRPSRAADGTEVGGLGIKIIRSFASTVKYERLATGNRLTLGFSWP